MRYLLPLLHQGPRSSSPSQSRTAKTLSAPANAVSRKLPCCVSWLMGMASITKVMTAMVALDSGIDLDKPCNIVSVDLEEGSVLANYSTSEHPTLRELLQVLLVHSANDVAYNIAINVAGSEKAFADLMNKKAAEIGMTNTHFSNPHGLDADDHYSTARDLALMARYAREHYPFLASTVSMTSVTATVQGEEVTWPSIPG